MIFFRIHYQFYAFWRLFLVKVRYYSIDLINECLSVMSIYYIVLVVVEERL